MNVELEELLLPEQVAEKLHVGKSTVYKLAATGVIPGIKIGAALRFSPAAVQARLAEIQQAGLGHAA